MVNRAFGGGRINGKMRLERGRKDETLEAIKK
jgi:hypothetical protein